MADGRALDACRTWCASAWQWPLTVPRRMDTWMRVEREILAELDDLADAVREAVAE